MVLPTGTVILNFYASADKSSLAHTGFVTLENGTGQYRFSEQGLGIYRVETKYFGDVNFLSSDAAALERTVQKSITEMHRRLLSQAWRAVIR